MANDMTQGKTSLILIKFAIPMILSGIFQQLYNMVDSIVVGKFDGVNALAAVGASYPVTVLFISIATGAGIGCSVVVSQIFGKKDLEMMKTAVYTAILSIIVVALLAMGIGKVACNSIITLLGTPSEIFTDSAAYLEIYTYGILFLFLYNICTSIFNGLGDSKTSLCFLIFSSVLNIILDIIFVKYLKWSVKGVAWATFIAQGTASMLALMTLLRKISKIEVEGEVKYFNGGILKRMIHIAVPSILQFSTVAIGQLMVQALVNSFGPVVIGGYAAAVKIDSFCKVALQNVGSAVSNFTAQNYGANKPERIKEGYFSSIKMTAVYSLILFAVIYLFGDVLIGLFDNGSAGTEVIDIGTGYMKINIPFYFIFSIMMAGNGVLRGTGHMGAFTFATAVDLIIRVGVSYLFVGMFGYTAIWWAVPLGWVAGMVISTKFSFSYFSKSSLISKR